jgi:hypothetical protein
MPIPSQYPLGMTIFTVHWSKDGGSDETHRINSVVAVAKAGSSKHPATEFALRIAGAANSRHANSANYSIKPRASLSARDF